MVLFVPTQPRLRPRTRPSASRCSCRRPGGLRSLRRSSTSPGISCAAPRSRRRRSSGTAAAVPDAEHAAVRVVPLGSLKPTEAPRQASARPRGLPPVAPHHAEAPRMRTLSEKERILVRISKRKEEMMVCEDEVQGQIANQDLVEFDR
nr:uncharacterized protein LOC127333176 [Lolium perenne]